MEELEKDFDKYFDMVVNEKKIIGITRGLEPFAQLMAIETYEESKNSQKT